MLGLCLVASIQGFDGNWAGWGHPADFTDQRLAGEWIAEHTDPDDRVITRSMVVDFYAERPTVALPYAELPQVVAYALHYGARYVVADSAHIGRFRPPTVCMLLERGRGRRPAPRARSPRRGTLGQGVGARPGAASRPTPRGPLLGFMGDG